MWFPKDVLRLVWMPLILPLQPPFPACDPAPPGGVEGLGTGLAPIELLCRGARPLQILGAGHGQPLAEPRP